MKKKFLQKAKNLLKYLVILYCLSSAVNVGAQSSTRKKTPLSIGVEGNSLGLGMSFILHANRSFSYALNYQVFQSDDKIVKKSTASGYAELLYFILDSSNVYFGLGAGNTDKEWNYDLCEFQGVTPGECSGLVKWPISTYNASFGGFWVDTRSGASGGVAIKFYSFGEAEYKMSDTAKNLIKSKFSDDIDAEKTAIVLSVIVGVSF